jgi:hypothetical protein
MGTDATIKIIAEANPMVFWNRYSSEEGIKSIVTTGLG